MALMAGARSQRGKQPYRATSHLLEVVQPTPAGHQLQSRTVDGAGLRAGAGISDFTATTSGSVSLIRASVATSSWTPVTCGESCTITGRPAARATAE